MNRATTLTLAVALGVTAIATVGRAASAAPLAGPPSGRVVAARGCDRDALQTDNTAAFVGSPRTFRGCGLEQGGESHLIAADFMSSATPVAFPPPSGDVPDDWTELVDDTGTLGISVPSTWTATDTSPTVDDKGTPQPMVSATTDESFFVPPEGLADTYSVPGLIYYAVPVQAITPARLEASAFTGDCTAGPIETYDDGAYVGYVQSFDGCGGTASRIVELVANPRLGSVTVVLLVQLTGRADDASTLDGLLSAIVDFSGFDAVTSSIFTEATTTTEADLGSTAPAIDGGPLVVIQQLVQSSFGLTITAEQASCLVNHPSGLGPPSHPATLETLENCGVDVLDIPSG